MEGHLEDAFDDFLCFIDLGAEQILDLERGFDFLDKELLQIFPAEENKYSKFFQDRVFRYLYVISV